MKKALWISVLSMFSLGALSAPDDIKVCEVIPVGDVESALGFKAARTTPGYRQCQWVAATGDTFANAKAFVRHAHKIDMKKYPEQMKKAGATVTVIDDRPDLWCAKIAMAGARNSVQCMVLTKGHYMELLASGPAITPEKAKALLARMTAKLP